MSSTRDGHAWLSRDRASRFTMSRFQTRPLFPEAPRLLRQPPPIGPLFEQISPAAPANLTRPGLAPSPAEPSLATKKKKKPNRPRPSQPLRGKGHCLAIMPQQYLDRRSLGRPRNTKQGWPLLGNCAATLLHQHRQPIEPLRHWSYAAGPQPDLAPRLRETGNHRRRSVFSPSAAANRKPV